jgi:hypothetical protein
MNKAATCKHMSVVATGRLNPGGNYLEVVGWLRERIEQEQAVLSSHASRPKEDGGGQKQGLTNMFFFCLFDSIRLFTVTV